MKKTTLLCSLLLAIILSGCGAASETPVQLESIIPPSATLEPTATSTPSPTIQPTNTPTPSPTPFAGGGQIAFWAFNEPGDLKLYLANPDGTEQRVIFDPQEYGHPPEEYGQFTERLGGTWSADGQYLLFSLTDLNQYYLYLYDRSADSVEFLANQPIFVVADWFKNENSIFLNHQGELVVVRTDNGIQFQTIPYPQQAGVPLGALDDGRILYLETDLAPGNTIIEVGKDTLIYLDADEIPQFAGIPKELTLFTINHAGESVRVAEVTSDLHLALQQLSSTFNIRLFDRALYFISGYSQEDLPAVYSIFRYDLESSTLQKIFTFPVGIDISIKAFSSDGRYVCIGEYDAATDQSSDAILDLSTLELLYESGKGYLSPTWSPDNNYLLFYRFENNGTSTIYRLDLATGEETTIIDGVSYIADPAWGP